MNIYLTQFRGCSHYEVVSIIRDGNSGRIGADGLKGLLRILPEKDEVGNVFNIKYRCVFCYTIRSHTVLQQMLVHTTVKNVIYEMKLQKALENIVQYLNLRELYPGD